MILFWNWFNDAEVIIVLISNVSLTAVVFRTTVTTKEICIADCKIGDVKTNEK